MQRRSRETEAENDAAQRTHLSLAARHRDVDEAPGVRESLLCPTLGGLLLLLGFDLASTASVSPTLVDARSEQETGSVKRHARRTASTTLHPYLWRGRAHFAGTSERAVHFTHTCGAAVDLSDSRVCGAGGWTSLVVCGNLSDVNFRFAASRISSGSRGCDSLKAYLEMRELLRMADVVWMVLDRQAGGGVCSQGLTLS